MKRTCDRWLGSRGWALMLGLGLALPPAPARAAAPKPVASEAPPAEPVLEAEPEPEPAPEPEPEPEPEVPDELRLQDGTVLRGHLVEVHEGAYATIDPWPDPKAPDGDVGRRSVPWSQIESLVVARGRSEPLRLATTRTGLGRPSEPSPDAPFIELVVEGERPVTLAALRGPKQRGSSRYRSGFTIECRAPCRQVVEGTGRTFFVETDPWLTSRLFTLPPKTERVRIDVKLGNRDMRIAGASFLGLSAAGLTVGVTLLAAVAPRRRVLYTTGLTWVSLTPVFLLTGGILMGLGRTRVEVAPMGVAAAVTSKGKRRGRR